jgi:hypothetical protein
MEVEGNASRMRKVFIRTLGIISGLGGLALIPPLLFNFCGLAHLSGDCADGPAWMNGLIVLGCAFLIAAAFYLSYRLFKLPLPS